MKDAPFDFEADHRTGRHERPSNQSQFAREQLVGAAGVGLVGLLGKTPPPGQSWTDFILLSRSTQSVVSADRVFSSEVLPTPDGPNRAIVVVPRASARA